VLVLASASPRRHALLRWLGVDFVIDVADIDERERPDEDAGALVARLAREKAWAVAERRPEDWILAADTLVELDGALLGKPGDAAEAASMVRRLQGREHRVFTGFVLLGPGGSPHGAGTVVTRVRFRRLGSRAVDAYVASGEPDGKAGGYAIQGVGAGLIEGIEGSFTNVIGLPLDEVEAALREAGLLGG
jgi:septum formation protein